jgi:hypothetical protein
MSDDFAHTLQYAGAEPYREEEARDDISVDEFELLTQDSTYQRLAQVRYLADKMLTEAEDRSDLPDDVRAALTDAVGAQDAPIGEAVNAYVDDWLAEHRRDERPTCEGHGCDAAATHEYEVNAPVRGHDLQYLCGDCVDDKQTGPYATVRELDDTVAAGGA